ncbi:class I SAM-dependent methyltransferase [Kribbella deserti]|uniref:Class I SAM-dependent methyltransferase n=1 Tax=Kribbella deserti TaxID=1926257 RepID=A0ABV6QPC2_9ACTN
MQGGEFAAVKAKQQQTWSSGNYAVIGTMLQLTGENLCEAVDVVAGERVLDVAAGNGNASLAAARRGGQVTSTDYVPSLLEQGRARAEAEGLPMTFETADAEALPYEDESFDLVLSTFGVMFTPDQARAAAELTRVCRGGGRIGMTAWTPGGFIGQVFKIVGSFVAPPAGVASPLRWGDVDAVTDLFKGQGSVRVDTLDYVFRSRSAREWVDMMREYYGPIHKAFGALEPTRQAEFEAALIELAEGMSTTGDGQLRVPSAYLQVVVTRD